MSKKSAMFLLVVALAGGAYYYYRTWLHCPFLAQKKITIAGKEYDVRPKESLGEMGCRLRRVADSRNAAVLYVEASNVHETPLALHGSNPALWDTVHDVTRSRWVDDHDLAEWLRANEECLELLHKAARKPDCEFLVLGRAHEMAAARSLPMAPQMRGFARLLVCEGKRHEYHNDCSRALDSYLAIAALSDHYHGSNPFLITDLTAIACHTFRNGAVEMCLANNDLDEKDLRRVIRKYERILAAPLEPTDALKREKFVTDSTIDLAIKSPELAWIALSSSGSASAADRDTIAGLIKSRGAELRAAYEHDYEALMRWSALPAWQALRPENDWAGYLARLPRQSIFSRGLLGSLGRAKKSYARSEAESGGILIVAAIKLYERKNDRPPESLAELKGDYISELPKDPFSGRAYIYKVRGNDWILYSVWDNLRDDGGVGSWPHKRKTDRDFVWRNTRLPEH